MYHLTHFITLLLLIGLTTAGNFTLRDIGTKGCELAVNMICGCFKTVTVSKTTNCNQLPPNQVIYSEACGGTWTLKVGSQAIVYAPMGPINGPANRPAHGLSNDHTSAPTNRRFSAPANGPTNNYMNDHISDRANGPANGPANRPASSPANGYKSSNAHEVIFLHTTAPAIFFVVVTITLIARINDGKDWANAAAMHYFTTLITLLFLTNLTLASFNFVLQSRDPHRCELKIDGICGCHNTVVADAHNKCEKMPANIVAKGSVPVFKRCQGSWEVDTHGNKFEFRFQNYRGCKNHFNTGKAVNDPDTKPKQQIELASLKTTSSITITMHSLTYLTTLFSLFLLANLTAAGTFTLSNKGGKCNFKWDSICGCSKTVVADPWGPCDKMRGNKNGPTGAGEPGNCRGLWDIDVNDQIVIRWNNYRNCKVKCVLKGNSCTPTYYKRDEVGLPEGNLTEADFADGSSPEDSMPEDGIPQGSMPKANALEATAPELHLPEGSLLRPKDSFQNIPHAEASPPESKDSLQIIPRHGHRIQGLKTPKCNPPPGPGCKCHRVRRLICNKPNGQCFVNVVCCFSGCDSKTLAKRAFGDIAEGTYVIEHVPMA
ncbi:MAG: hypothetical protein Q9166_006997 [cf. Caloplaca sp. 2 TL-2023]